MMDINDAVSITGDYSVSVMEGAISTLADGLSKSPYALHPRIFSYGSTWTAYLNVRTEGWDEEPGSIQFTGTLRAERIA